MKKLILPILSILLFISCGTHTYNNDYYRNNIENRELSLDLSRGNFKYKKFIGTSKNHKGKFGVKSKYIFSNTYSSITNEETEAFNNLLTKIAEDEKPRVLKNYYFRVIYSGKKKKLEVGNLILEWNV